MIFDGSNPNWAEVADRNEAINHHNATNSKVPCCGHDFWAQTKIMDFGDVVLCNRCQVYYAKIKHLPWIVKPSKGFRWQGNKLITYLFGNYHTNHLGFRGKNADYNFNRKDEYFMVAVPARVTD
jgi:hypothetical protein